jgi:hypothetical protein
MCAGVLRRRRRYSAGVIPVARRNARVKLACDEKRAFKAICASGNLPGSSLEPAMQAAPNNVVASACEFHNLRKEFPPVQSELMKSPISMVKPPSPVIDTTWRAGTTFSAPITCGILLVP